MSCCEHYETTGSNRGGNFVDKPKINIIFFLEKDTPWSWFINITLHMSKHAYK